MVSRPIIEVDPARWTQIRAVYNRGEFNAVVSGFSFAALEPSSLALFVFGSAWFAALLQRNRRSAACWPPKCV
jgi:hypothetical protein